MALIDLGFASELEDRVVNACRFHDASVQRDVAVQNGKAAIFGERVFYRADHAAFAITVELFVAVLGRERFGRANTTRCSAEEFVHFRVVGGHHVPLCNGFGHSGGVNGADVAMEQAAAMQFTKDRHDAASAVHVFHVNIRFCRGNFGQARNLARQTVHVRHRKVHFALMSDSEKVENGVGRTTHRNIERHCVLKRFKRRDVTRQKPRFLFFVVRFGDFNDLATRLEEEFLAIRMRCENRTVTRQSKAERLSKAVHRVRGEHTRARATGRAGGFLNRVNFFISIFVVSCSNHRVNEVERVL